MKGRTQERKQQGWHVKQHYNGLWAVYDAQGKFRRTFAQQAEAQRWADERNAERGKGKR